MKIKKTVDICRHEGVARIYNGAREMQWLSCGYACYPLYEIPELSEEEFFTIFDFTPKQREEMVFERADLPLSISTQDFYGNEELCERLSPNIPFGSKLLIPFSTLSGIKFLDSEYLSPLADEVKSIEVYERTPKSGETYFAVKVGMSLRAIIMPFNAINKSFVDNIEKIYFLCQKALSEKETEDARQIGVFTDNTGEVVGE